MNRLTVIKHRYLIIAVLCVVSLASCSHIRKLTYPDSLVYIDSRELESTMHAMAGTIVKLDALLALENAEHIATDEVLALLDRLDQQTYKLGKPDVITNHAVIDQYLPEFRAAIARARLLSSASPPNYYLAGRLSGQCSACHQFR